MKIVLYRDGSPLSEESATFLRDLGVAFEEVDATTKEGYERLLKRTRGCDIPAFELKRAHSIGIIFGLNKELLRRELGGK